MNEKERVEQRIASWITSESSEQPLLVISHGGELREALCTFASRVVACTKNSSSPCGICSGCKQVAARTHPDTITILGEKGRIKIKDVDSLKGILATTSSKRIICIPYADMLLPEAANSLLKTLEEPTPTTRFLLGAKSTRSVLATIRSRCVVVSLSHSLPSSDFDTHEALKRLSEVRKPEPFREEELSDISKLVHALATEKGSSPELFKVAQRLRDYHKTASMVGGNTKLAADILLASLANLRNTTK